MTGEAQPPPVRASFVGTVIGLLLIATAVSAAGLWLRGYTQDRREVWLLNEGPTTAVLYLGPQRRTLLAGESMPARAPNASAFELTIQTGTAVTTQTVTRAVDRQEVLLISVSPRAAYAVVDVTDRFLPPDVARRRAKTGEGRPRLLDVAAPARVIRLPGGDGATVGPLERLPTSVWLARRYGRSVHKVFRLAPDRDAAALSRAVTAAWAEDRSLVTLEYPLRPKAAPATP